MTIEMQLQGRDRDTLLALYSLERDGVSPSTEQDLAAHLGYRYIEEFEPDSPEIEHAVRTLQRFGLLDLDDCRMTLTTPGRAMAMRVRGQGPTDRPMMKAVRVHAYGSPEVLVCEEVPRPELADGEALVRICAASVNPVDLVARQGGPYSLPFIPGWDYSGVVEAVGPGVTTVGPGSPVYGMLDLHRGGGAQAEYLVAPAASLLPKPQALDHVQAAAVPVAGLTAWQALYDHADLWRGQTVLIRDADSGVGAFALQLARCAGARVIATARPENLDYVSSLGADEALTGERLCLEGRFHSVDVVLDSTGQGGHESIRSALRPGGVILSTASTTEAHHQTVLDGLAVLAVVAESNHAELARITELIDEGKVLPSVGTVLPLTAVRQAHVQLERGLVRGKIVLRVGG